MPASTRGVSAEMSISARGVPAEMSISARGVPALTNRLQRRRTMRSTAPSRSASARHGAFGGVVLSVVRGSPLRDSLLGNGVVLSDSLLGRSGGCIKCATSSSSTRSASSKGYGMLGTAPRAVGKALDERSCRWTSNHWRRLHSRYSSALQPA